MSTGWAGPDNPKPKRTLPPKPWFTHDEMGWGWFCCFDHAIGDTCGVWDTEQNRDLDFIGHMKRCHEVVDQTHRDGYNQDPQEKRSTT